MAGHSQWKNIMYRKGAQDAKRSRLFTRLIRELTTAARSGMPDPAMNPRLRVAVQAAKAANVPRDTIARAIKRGGDPDEAETFVEIRYEGFAPGGVAVIVEALTDNRNRTAADVRTAFTKNGGNLAESGSVSYLFDRIGEVIFPAAAATAEEALDAAVEAGADDCDSSDIGHQVACAPDALNSVRDTLESRLGPCQNARLIWRPQTTIPVDENDAPNLFKLLEALEDSDDVQSVSANYEVSDTLMENFDL